MDNWGINTGETIRLVPDYRNEISVDSTENISQGRLCNAVKNNAFSGKYSVDEPGEDTDAAWIVRERKPRKTVQPTVPLARDERQSHRSAGASGGTLQQDGERPTQWRSQRRVTPNDLLMPCILALGALLAIVGVGGYTELRTVPAPLIVIVVSIVLLSFGRYRTSRAYKRNGDTFKAVMTHYHNQDGTMNRQAVKRVFRNNP